MRHPAVADAFRADLQAAVANIAEALAASAWTLAPVKTGQALTEHGWRSGVLYLVDS
jgi:hypothetical protein